MGPNGETPSWTLSHDPSVGASVGAFGGFEGFQGTVVVFTAPAFGDLSATFGNRESDAEAFVGGPSLLALNLVDELDAAIVVPT